MAIETKLYECIAAGFFMGDYYAVGARKRWLPVQVKYDGNQWREVELPVAAADAKASAEA